MPELQLAVDVSCLNLPLRKALPLAASWRVRAVQLAVGEEVPLDLSGTGVRHVRKLLEDHNQRAVALTFATRRGYYTLEGLERRVEATRQALRLAHSLGADALVVQLGRVPMDDTAEWRLLVEVLGDLGAASQRAGALLAAETGGESAADVARLLAALPTGYLGITLDPGRLVMGGFDPVEMVHVAGDAVLHVQARDGIRDRSQDTSAEVTLGRGSVDYPAVLAALEECGYRGFVSVVRHGSEDPAAEMQRAVQYLRSL